MKNRANSQFRRLLGRGLTIVAVTAASVVLSGNLSTANAMPPSGSGLHTVGPVRVLDTRNGTGAPQAPLGANSTLVVNLPDGVPGQATAVVVNVTVINGSQPSYLTAFATGTDKPGTSTVNWWTGSAVANEATIAVKTIPNALRAGMMQSRQVSLYNAAGTVNVVVDLIGYFSPGTDGATGPQGPAGDVGPAGPIGPAGVDGAVGPAGPIGTAGAAGSVGPIGPVGPIGLPGVPGEVGPVGPAGAVGAIGPDGGKGATGAAGADGPIGPMGLPGLPGADGAVGPAGPKGADGKNGIPGNEGVAGPAGDIGPAGPVGADGEKGATGATGDPGPKGATGAKGDTGAAAPAVYLQAVNTAAQTIPTGSTLTFGTKGVSLGGITFMPGSGDFVVEAAGTYQLTVSILANVPNQFTVRVNGTPSNYVFGAPANVPTVGTAILQLSSGDIVDLANLTSTGVVPPPVGAGPAALSTGNVTLSTTAGGSGVSINASIVIQQLADAPAPPCGKGTRVLCAAGH